MRYLILFFLIFASLPLSAQINTLLVHRTDKTTDKYLLEENPVTKFNGGNIVISTTTVTKEYPRGTVASYTYNEEDTGIKQILGLQFKQEGDTYLISGSSSKAVQLYDINGTLLENHTCTGDAVIIKLNQRPVGTYLIKAGEETIKILRK